MQNNIFCAMKGIVRLDFTKIGKNWFSDLTGFQNLSGLKGLKPPIAYFLNPGPFTNLPGFAPVCSPSFKTCTPFTNT